MRAVSLFSGAGIGESRLHEIGIEVVVANELIENRANLHKQINPLSNMVQGDIRERKVKDRILALAPKTTDLLIATPPCQGVSIAGKNRKLSEQADDDRNYLITPILEFIEALQPKYVLIENVPQYLNLELPVRGKMMTVVEILQKNFAKEYEIESGVINCAHLGVPQSRKRSFIKLFNKGLKWDWPDKTRHEKTLAKVISHLPSLESGEESEIPWHYARNHSSDHILWMSHTPTGKSAFENPVHFPKGRNGKPINAYNTTYRRMEWDKPAPAITMRNDAISSQMNVHPGYKRRNGTFSDARVLTPHELMIVNSMNLKHMSKIVASEILIRRVLGEGVPPLAINKILRPIVG